MRALAIAVAFGLLATSACEPARRVRRHTDIEPGFRPVEYRVPGKQFRLANGLRVVLLPRSSTNVVRVSVRYTVGAAEDPVGKAGLAHLVEHMTFATGLDGTPLSDRLAATALSYNGYTSWDQTHYYATALAARLGAVLEIEADRMRARCEQFDEAVLERERDVVDSEIRQRSGPYAAMRNITLTAVYAKGHAYARPVGGSRRDVGSMSAADVCAFVDDYYSPERAVLVVSGNFDELETAMRIEKLFRQVPTSRTPDREIVGRVELTGSESEHELPIERATAVIVTPGKVFTDREAVYEQMLASILDDELEELVEKDDNIALASVLRIGGERAPLNAVVITVTDPTVLRKAVDAFFEHRAGVGRVITGFRHRRTSTSHAVSLLRAVESLSSRDHLMASFVQHGNSARSVEQGLQWRLRSTSSDLRGRMKDFFARDRTHVAYFFPDETDDTMQGRAVVQVAGGHDVEDQRPTIAPTELERDLALPATTVDLEVKRFRLDNGMRVRLVPNLEVPIFEVRLVFAGGSLHDPPELPGLAEATARLLEFDLSGEWWPEDRRYVGNALQYAAPFYTAVGEATTTFRARGLATHIDATLWSLGFLVEEGRHQAKDLTALQRVLALEIDDEDRADQRREDAARRALFGPSHPYASPGLRDTTANEITVEALREFGRTHYRARGAVLVVAGQFDAEQVERVIRDVFGGWSDTGAAPSARTVPAAKTATQQYYAVVDEDAGQLAITFAFAPAPAKGRERAALDVLQKMLQDEAQLLRDRLASTYGITVSLTHRSGPGQLLVQGEIDAERGAEAFVALRDILLRFRAGEELAQPFLRARRHRLALVLAESHESARVAARLASVATEDAEDARERAEWISALRLDDVQRVIASELGDDAGIVLLHGPKDAVEAAYSAARITDFETLD